MRKILFGALIAFAGIVSYTEAASMDALSLKEQKIAEISASAATGDMQVLRIALAAGLDAGLNVNEIKEMLTQLYAYCGFPRSLNALGCFMTLVKEREAAGVRDAAGKLPGPLPAGRSIDFGTANQTRLTGAPVKGALFEFAPAVDEFLKAHLFGDIFGRDNLDWKTRELVTIAALGAMDGVESQLDSHIRIGKHNGLSDAQIKAVLAIADSCRKTDVFPKGDPAPVNFSGPAWVARLLDNKDYDLSVYNVTFAPGTRNNWHSHSVGQVLLCTVGVGYYQERGKAARRLVPGDVVEIPADTEHWHGAAPDSEFVHIGMTPKMSGNRTAWGGPVTDAEYVEATSGR